MYNTKNILIKITPIKLISPRREWIMLLILFVSIVLYFLYFDYNIYNKVVSGEMYVNVEKDELNLVYLEKNRIDLLLNKFEERKEYISKIKIEKNIDPSL